MRELFFITGNPAKAKYRADYFKYSVKHMKIDLAEMQPDEKHETSMRKIALEKLKRYLSN